MCRLKRLFFVQQMPKTCSHFALINLSTQLSNYSKLCIVSTLFSHYSQSPSQALIGLRWLRRWLCSVHQYTSVKTSEQGNTGRSDIRGVPTIRISELELIAIGKARPPGRRGTGSCSLSNARNSSPVPDGTGEKWGGRFPQSAGRHEGWKKRLKRNCRRLKWHIRFLIIFKCQT